MAEILVVDDDSQVVEQTCRLITDMGHNADFLVESSLLVAKLEAGQVDLILLDVNMPVVDGISLLKELKANQKFVDIPVIMVTGETGEKLISQCFEIGAVDFINKPIRPLELQSRVRIALETRQHILAINKKNGDLARAKAFSETILNSMDDAIVVLNESDFSVVDANIVFQEKVGKSLSELLGAPCYDTGREPFHPCYPCNGHTPSCILSATISSGNTNDQEYQHGYEQNGKRYTKVITIPIKRPDKKTDHILLISRDVTQARLLQDRLRHLAFHDVLTGLPNRQLFYDRIDQSIAISNRSKKMMAIMFFDLDRFKKVNDTLGHDVGDQLLVEVANRLSSCVRKSDTIARMGGDEFTAVLNGVDTVSQVEKLANKILKSLGKKFILGEHSINVTSSIGISLFPKDGENIDTLTKNADKALYLAKGAGRNNAQFYSKTSAKKGRS
ncbi:MAG: diguanylate cyclase [Magnetococcales bacterium]|nr:diguanylate cyclase [Magnetococcales bacterium]